MCVGLTSAPINFSCTQSSKWTATWSAGWTQPFGHPEQGKESMFWFWTPPERAGDVHNVLPQSRKNLSQHLLRAEFFTETKSLSFMWRSCSWKTNEDEKGDPPKSRMNMEKQISREGGYRDLAVLLHYACCSCLKLGFQASVPKSPSVHGMPVVSLPQLSFPPHLDCQFSREQLQGTVGQSAGTHF